MIFYIEMPPAFEENILCTIEENPGTSCRRIKIPARKIKPSHCVEHFA